MKLNEYYYMTSIKKLIFDISFYLIIIVNYYIFDLFLISKLQISKTIFAKFASEFNIC